MVFQRIKGFERAGQHEIYLCLGPGAVTTVHERFALHCCERLLLLEVDADHITHTRPVIVDVGDRAALRLRGKLSDVWWADPPSPHRITGLGTAMFIQPALDQDRTPWQAAAPVHAPPAAFRDNVVAHPGYIGSARQHGRLRECDDKAFPQELAQDEQQEETDPPPMSPLQEFKHRAPPALP